MSNSYNMKNINKWKAVKIIFFFAMSLIIITGTLSAVIRTYFDTGFKNIYLIPLFLVLINFAYIWRGKKTKQQLYLCSNYCINNCNYFKINISKII